MSWMGEPVVRPRIHRCTPGLPMVPSTGFFRSTCIDLRRWRCPTCVPKAVSSQAPANDTFKPLKRSASSAATMNRSAAR
jgi:hypothetical protein